MDPGFPSLFVLAGLAIPQRRGPFRGGYSTLALPPAPISSWVRTRRPPPIVRGQPRYCQSCVRSLKMEDAAPFLKPVDIVRYPTDVSTIERKLNSLNPDPNPRNPRYRTHGLTFNGPDHLIVQMGKRLEGLISRCSPKETPPPPPITSAQKKSLPVRRPPPEPISHRPKRETHPPPPKDLPYADASKKPCNKVKPEANEQLRFRSKLLGDLHKKQYYNNVHPFYPVSIELPSSPKIIKPINLSMMRRKLDNRDYPTAQWFYDDFKFMIKNCMPFLVRSFEKVLLEKWRNILPLSPVISDDEDDEDDGNDSDADGLRAVAQMEAQIEVTSNLERLKSARFYELLNGWKSSSVKKRKDGDGRHSQPSKKKTKKLIPDDILAFEQKKDLSETIGTLEGAELEKVNEGVPEIRDVRFGVVSTEEFELKIDTLPTSVLTELYNFVIRPLKQLTVERSRTGKGAGTSGPKRKSMDEDVEVEKQGACGAPPPPLVRDGDGIDSDLSLGSSDSDSDPDREHLGPVLGSPGDTALISS
ncbi:hypothetical protein FA13DRAFT_1757593 [Coprinellus micaceus]|uniref:Bromo domain-containing protein n=1 Tax=Coprinellus micaceus TaxID=71717 RepID=A0A4Y7SHS9_COPMI|nr:hypothetical protein FA13DRAFT_1757593 [Coprinellus micaceus]